MKTSNKSLDGSKKKYIIVLKKKPPTRRPNIKKTA